MKYVIITLLYVLTLGLTASEPKKIRVEKHLVKPLYRIRNDYDQAVFCVVTNKGKHHKFYIAKKSFRYIDEIDPATFRFMCFEPEKKV